MTNVKKIKFYGIINVEDVQMMLQLTLDKILVTVVEDISMMLMPIYAINHNQPVNSAKFGMETDVSVNKIGVDTTVNADNVHQEPKTMNNVSAQMDTLMTHNLTHVFSTPQLVDPTRDGMEETVFVIQD